MTVDVESFFHGHPMYGSFSSNRLCEADAGHVVIRVNEILDIFKNANVKATFFIVSEIAEWYPKLIDNIVKDGHEIGFHSANHKILSSPFQLEQQLELAEEFLKIYSPIGFKAPYYYLERSSLKLLKEFDFKYDSSVYGFTKPFLDKTGIWEIPITQVPFLYNVKNLEISYPSPLTINQFLKGFPLGSGIIWGFPLTLIKKFALKSLQKGINPIFTIHPWQLNRPRYAYFLSRTFLTHHPWWIPYSFPIKDKLIKITQLFNFQSIKENLKQFISDT